jgi:hypothetical protein
MRAAPPRALAALATLALALATLAASPAPKPAPPKPAAAATGARNDYANPSFTAPLGQGLKAFYSRDFSGARKGFEDALAVIPDNTLALSFLNATAAQMPGTLDTLIDAEEEQLAKNPKSALPHVKLAFSYLFASLTGRDRTVDARRVLKASITANADTIYASALLKKIDDGAYGKLAPASPSPGPTGTPAPKRKK